MKKLNKFCAILFAMLGVSTLSAQTDVTSTYLTNAGFEADGHQTGTKVPTGWTLGTTSGGYTSYRPISDTSTPNGSLPISDGVTNGASEGSCYLYVRTNWGASTCELTQTTQTLPAGKYKLMVDVALPQTEVSRLRTLTIKVTGSTSGTTNSVECCYNPAIWTTVSVPFETTVEETVVVSLYHNDTSGGCTDGVLTAIDNVRILSYDYAAMTSALTEAESLYDSSKEGATELNTAMTTAKSLTESSDKSSIASAAETLIEALDTYKQAQFVVPSSTDYTSWISNAQLETTTGGTVFSSKASMWNSNIPYDWSVTRAVNGNMNATTFGSGQSGKAFEIWATDANTVIGTMFQSVDGLPAGKYTLKGYLQNSGKLFVANGAETTEYSSSPSTTGAWQQFSITFVKKSASDNLVVGAQTTAAQHFIVDDFSLECIGLDLLQLTSQRDGLVGDLEELQSKLPSTYYSGTVAPALETAKSADSESTLTAAINELSSILTTANTISGPYTELNKLIALCTEYTDSKNSNANSADVLTTFQTAINTATTDGNAATTVDAINTVHNTLETARRTYAKNAVPVYPYPFDMTFLLPNTTFDSNTDGWTKTGGANWMSAGKNVECYNTTFEFSMEYSGLNNGSWEIQVDAFYRYGGYNAAEAAHNGGTEQLLATLYANNNTVAVKSIMEGANKAGSVGAITTAGVRVPNAPAHCDAYFATGCYANSIATVIADGNLKVGIKKETTQGSDWTIFDNFKLIYKGVDVTEMQTSLSTLITKASDIKETKMGSTEQSALSTALSTADATVTDADELSTMITNLQSAYDAAVASIDLYTTVLPYITKAEGIDASIATTYRTQYDNGTISENAETIRQVLNVATAEYVAANFKNEIALTEWGAESNAMWSTSGQHWDGTTGDGCTTYYDANGTNATHTLSKTVELTAGTYIFRGAGRSNANTKLSLSISIDGIAPVVFYAKDDTGYGIDTDGKATFAEDATYANEDKGRGWEWEFIKFTLAETTTVTLTATSQTTGWGWASFANNGLWMDDATYLSVRKATAQALVDTPMAATEKNALTASITGAEDAISSSTGLAEAITAINTAITDAEASIAEYKIFATYIAKANAIDESIAADYQTQYNNGTISESTEVVFQNLEVATYNYVTENFEYPVALSDTWNSTGTNTSAADFSDEHWSGEARKYKNQFDGWGDPKQGYPANSWSIDFDQEVTLPAGKYVFKVAGRKSVDTALELVVTEGENVLGTVNDFPSGNSGLGINKAGATSFDANDPVGFAVLTNAEGVVTRTGFGWQWRYVMFELAEEATVKVAVHAETSKIYNWVSFGDYTLQMTEETYLEANKGGVEVAETAAQALVNTKPMGDAENAALQAALDMTYTTGAEMLAKANALDAAITNANAWVKAYNDAKAPLVAALERFEADYNDEEHEVLHVTGYWTNVINNVKAAALAKDVTNSYDGFAEATSNLVAALNAVDNMNKANINITADNKWSTCVLLFDVAELPEGLRAFESDELTEGSQSLVLKEVAALKAYTPYILYAQEGYQGTLTGAVDFTNYVAVASDGIALKGAVEQQTITEGYILQNQGYGMKFYKILDRTEFTIPVGKCWLEVGSFDTATQAVTLKFKEGTTGIEGVALDVEVLNEADGIYTIDGKRVSDMQKGQIYVVGGKKTINR